MSVPGHIDDAAGSVVGGVGNTVRLHQPGVAGQHHLTVHQGADALPGDLLGIGGPPVIGLGAGRPQAFADGVAGKTLGQGRCFQQILFGYPGGGTDPGHGEDTLGQGAVLSKAATPVWDSASK